MSQIYQAHGATLPAQYRDAGNLFAESIQSAVRQLTKKRAKLSLLRKKVAESAWQNLQGRAAAREFVECLNAWSLGARVEPHEAMWLLADNLSGCQTMIARYGSGVAMLHTEEEFCDATHTEHHMTSPHTMAFRVDGEDCRTLVYNNLMPGCGLYGWKSDMIVAVDSLFLRQDGIEDVKCPLLANMISWMIWRMNPEEASPTRIWQMIETLGELVDGYAINVVRRVHNEIEGYKLILARAQHKIEYLGPAAGSYLRQANIVSQEDYPQLKWALPPRQIWRGGWKYFTGREKMMDRHAREYQGMARYCLPEQKIEAVHTAIQAEIFGALRAAYISPDLGAVCVGLVDQAGTSVSCKLNDMRSPGALEYLDKLD